MPVKKGAWSQDAADPSLWRRKHGRFNISLRPDSTKLPLLTWDMKIYVDNVYVWVQKISLFCLDDIPPTDKDWEKKEADKVVAFFFRFNAVK